MKSNSEHYVICVFCDGSIYLISELKNYITVHNYYVNKKGHPEFEFKQLVSTVPKKCDELSAACALRFSERRKDIAFCSNAGDNSVAFIKYDEENGLLRVQLFYLSAEITLRILLFSLMENILYP